jgi:hypothetical protein
MANDKPTTYSVREVATIDVSVAEEILAAHPTLAGFIKIHKTVANSNLTPFVTQIRDAGHLRESALPGSEAFEVVDNDTLQPVVPLPSVEELRSMSMEEYSARRDEILRSAAGLLLLRQGTGTFKDITSTT